VCVCVYIHMHTYTHIPCLMCFNAILYIKTKKNSEYNTIETLGFILMCRVGDRYVRMTMVHCSRWQYISTYTAFFSLMIFKTLRLT